MNNIERFESELVAQYRDLFASDADYACSAAHTTPETLAAKMTAGLVSGSASKDGKGIKRACKTFGIKHTYTAIRAFLNEVK